MRIRVSENGRFLVREDGAPFFYLADTAWELFHRLDAREAELYLRDRAAKGFTAIQAVALAELDGLNIPNANGDLPLHGRDPERPNEAYFAHVDRVVELAARMGLTVAMLPTWGDKWNCAKWGAGPEIFTPASAHAYGLFLGRRYREDSIIWVLGGDRPVETDAHKEIIRAMAAGLAEGDGGTHLATFHPTGWQGSSEPFHGEEWLSFNMWQSGHSRNAPNWQLIARDYARTPVKPVLDGEPGYEDHTASFDIANGYLDDYDVRKVGYWSVFAGACGHTYGCHPIWQFWQPGRDPLTWARRPWTEALHLPGSGQVRWLRSLVESRPYLTRVPDPSLVVSEAVEGVHHVEATRDEARTYALVYVPSGRPVEVALDALECPRVNAGWYDPRTGLTQAIGMVATTGRREFAPPPGGPDWVLTLDDASHTG
jgi:hypothetical protein